MSRYLKDAFFEGLRRVDTDDLQAAIAKHITTKGEWETGVISPSLTSMQCRLARLKKFLGDLAQPGLKRMNVRAGEVDAITNLNYIRGFTIEGAIIAALRAALGDSRFLGHAPELLFRWRYQGDDFLLSNWRAGGKPPGMIFAGHPDVMLWSDHRVPQLELIQIKVPTVYKLERISRLGDEDALESYRSQMATEMYIGRKLGYPIQRSHLMLVSTENTPRVDNPHCHIVTLPWDETLASIPEEIGRQIVKDYDAAYTMGEWPAAEPQHKWDSWPCRYCNYSRLSTFSLIGCEEQSEWERFEETGETRLTVPVPDKNNPKIVPMKKPRRRSA